LNRSASAALNRSASALAPGFGFEPLSFLLGAFALCFGLPTLLSGAFLLCRSLRRSLRGVSLDSFFERDLARLVARLRELRMGPRFLI
jgi:hypothetical protein